MGQKNPFSHNTSEPLLLRVDNDSIPNFLNFRVSNQLTGQFCMKNVALSTVILFQLKTVLQFFEESSRFPENLLQRECNENIQNSPVIVILPLCRGTNVPSKLALK